MTPAHQDFIRTYPRESLQIGFFGIVFVWNSLIALMGLLLYFLCVKTLRCSAGSLGVVGLGGMGLLMLLEQVYPPLGCRCYDLFIHGFALNGLLWKSLVTLGIPKTLTHFVSQEANPLLCFSTLFASGMGYMDRFGSNPHQAVMQSIRAGDLEAEASTLVSMNQVKRALKRLDRYDESSLNGTVIGVSRLSGQYVEIADQDLNQIVLVFGTTGGGKTVTLWRFYRRAMMCGYPLIIVDGKPSASNIDRLRAFAEYYQRPFIGFNCANYQHYNALAHGGYTELKDKIISLKDDWSSDHFKTIAEDYLQTAIQVLQRLQIPVDLQTVAHCLDYSYLVKLLRENPNPDLESRVKGLSNYETEELTGLKAHLQSLIHSELGHYLQHTSDAFNLHDAIRKNAIVYFALPALRFPQFQKTLGKLVINDLKTVIDRDASIHPIFMVFDEFSTFAGPQCLNLVNMGREKGVHAIFGTQGLAELDEVSPQFKRQLLNCANSIICHRLNDHDSAEAIAAWLGTETSFTVTAQVNRNHNEAAMGTVNKTRQFIIHPDTIKQHLATGEAIYMTKVGFKQDRIQIKLTELP